MNAEISEIAERKLSDAVAELYRVFRHYCGSPNWGDPLDNHPEEYTSLPSKAPVHQLPKVQAADLFWHGACHIYEHEQILAVKYFLPRAVEETLKDSFDPDCEPAFQWWFIAEQLARCRWNEWRMEDRTAIEAFLDAWWEATLAWNGWWKREANWLLPRPPESRQAETVLDFVQVCGAALQPKLAFWRSHNTPESALQLAQLAIHLAPKISWDRVPSRIEAELIQWLISAETCRQLEAAFFEVTDKAAGQRLSDAVAIIEPLVRESGV